MRRTQQKRLLDVADTYRTLVKPGPFTIAEVVEWAESRELLPVPTFRDSREQQDAWDGRFEDVVRNLKGES